MHISHFDQATGWLAEPHRDDPIRKLTEDP